jgi:hypothetical protein
MWHPPNSRKVERERKRDPDFLGELSLEELKKGCLNPMKVLGY